MNFWRFTFIRDKRLCHPSDLILYVLGYLSVTSHSNHQNQKLPTSLPHGLPLCVSPFCKKHRSFPRSSRFTVWGRIRVFPLQPAAPTHRIRSVSSCCCFVSLCCRSGLGLPPLLSHPLAQCFSNCCPGTRGNPQEPLRVSWGQNAACDYMKVLFAFFTFSHKCTVEFSRAHMSCDITTDWRYDNWMYDNPARFHEARQ